MKKQTFGILNELPFVNNAKKPTLKTPMRKAFTLVELIITMVILAILATISFINLSDYPRDARDAQRKSDLKSIEKAISLYQLETGKLPEPDEGTTQSGWIEGEFGQSDLELVKILGELPKDPKTGENYDYLVSDDGKVFKVRANLESGEVFKLGTYGVDGLLGGYILVNGVCGGTKDSCSTGVFTDGTDTSTQYHWSCVGSHGGAIATCSAPILVNGVCGGTKDSCSTGVFTDGTDTSTQYHWSCAGVNGGTDSSVCSSYKPINAQCGGSRNTCIVGSYGSYSDTSTQYRWRCYGEHGGSSRICSSYKPINAQCGGSRNTCIVGSYGSYSDTSTQYRWRCYGYHGGYSQICTSLKPPINGRCGTYLNSCITGTSLNLDSTYFGNNLRHVWVCRGINGGTQASCLSLLKGRCGTSKYTCAHGYVSNKYATPTLYYTWKCNGYNGASSASCSFW